VLRGSQRAIVSARLSARVVGGDAKIHHGASDLYSITGPLNSDFSWSSLINSDSTTASPTILWDKLRLGIFWTSWPSLDTISLSFWGIQTFWLASLCVWSSVGNSVTYLPY